MPHSLVDLRGKARHVDLRQGCTTPQPGQRVVKAELPGHSSGGGGQDDPRQAHEEPPSI